MEWRTGLHRLRQLDKAWGRIPQRIHEASQQWLSGCVELLFPAVCLLCGLSTPNGKTRICLDCQNALTGDGAVRCPRCAKPVPKHSQADVTGCPLCRDKHWRFQQAIALGTYGGEVRELVLRMKQPRHEALCLAAGELLAGRIRLDSAGVMTDVVVPVPMHWMRKFIRGVNAAEVLAEAVGSYLQVPFSTSLLRCRRPTRKQGTLLPTERQRNVLGAYSVKRRANIAGTHVLVVDDVMTTGATANELAKVLHRAGASRVSIAIVARGVGFD